MKQRGIYYSCKTCYYELFPEANERMRQRDFKHLNNIGYTITYDNYDRRYKMWDGYYLREDFGVFLKDGNNSSYTIDFPEDVSKKDYKIYGEIYYEPAFSLLPKVYQDREDIARRKFVQDGLCRDGGRKNERFSCELGKPGG